MSRSNTDNLSAAHTSRAMSSATDSRFDKPTHGWRRTLFTVIFEADTRAGLQPVSSGRHESRWAPGATHT